jgi:hypothetical protein
VGNSRRCSLKICHVCLILVLRPMTGSSGISEAWSPKMHVKLITVPYRFLQSRLMDISISDLNNDVSLGWV